MMAQSLNEIRLLAGLPLTEGFVGLSVLDSDSAADAMSDLVETIVKSLRAKLKNKGNEYNTPGYLNVAMIITEHFLSLKNAYSSEFHELVRDVIEQMESHRNDWMPEQGASVGLLEQYDAILKKLKSKA
jgi:hypothetical protein